jgi:hypothetical protein
MTGRFGFSQQKEALMSALASDAAPPPDDVSATALPLLAFAAPARIPLWFKVVYTAFVAVLVPYYWRAYSPWNFLYFCDIALLVTGVALWTESRLLASLQAVAILLPQTVWVIDFASRACGVHLLGLTDYMFNPSLPLLTRGLSLFHGWLPFLLVYLLIKLGYDRRAFALQCAIGLGLLLLCFFFAPAPPAPANFPNMAVNVNYVWGPDDKHPQTWMAPGLWVATLGGIFLLGIYTPTHLILRKVFPPKG